MEKGEKCWSPVFSPFPTMFSEALSEESLKVRTVWKRPLKVFFKIHQNYILDVFQMMIFVQEYVKNILKKIENTGYKYFLHFPQCLRKSYFSGLLWPHIL